MRPTSVLASPALERVRRGDLCAGCGACATVADGHVAMHLASPGYLRPVETGPLTSEEDAAIAAVCPGLSMTQEAGERTDHLLWGPIVTVRSGHAVDPGLRRTASSGGVLSALLVHLLETGAIDAVIENGASPSLPIGNQTVLARTAAEVEAAAGSRYAPSAPLEGLTRYLERPERFAFVGKPCDVAALRAMARRDPRIDARFPYMLSFFCAGVPSHSGAREILARLGVAEEELSAFRYRGNGWPGFATATRADGSQERMSYADSWGGILSRHVQFRCKICPDGTGGFADAVCADAWHCDEKGYPLFEEGEGTSLVISRTARGEELVRGAMAAGRIEVGTLAPDAVIAMQPGQTVKKRVALARIAALAATLRPVPRFRGFNLARAARTAGLRLTLRNFLGTCRRLLLARA